MCSVPGQKARCIIQLSVAQVIEAEEGDDVSLECQQDAEVSLEDSLVEWSKDNRTNLVHVYRHGRDYLNDQKEEFKGRTTLFHEGLSRGNVTLQLRSVRLSDSGRFRCYVKNWTSIVILPSKSCRKARTTQHKISVQLHFQWRQQLNQMILMVEGVTFSSLLLLSASSFVLVYYC
ncbi:myelin-oligodendrocyte glycoprotein-like [Thunnus thynnus]|uniref:myelin-oligodendrocyte glycoprotein-like n=1 Tax=Thunnus thynnus TaxID=8237 RepID=UPI003529B292